jgi:hypothetical protein
MEKTAPRLLIPSLRPFYDRVEPIFRVAGRNEGFAQIPDGKLLEDSSMDSLSVQRFIHTGRKRPNIADACGAQKNVHVTFASLTVTVFVPTNGIEVSCRTVFPRLSTKLCSAERSETTSRYVPGLSLVTFFPLFVIEIVNPGPTAPLRLVGALLPPLRAVVAAIRPATPTAASALNRRIISRSFRWLLQ